MTRPHSEVPPARCLDLGTLAVGVPPGCFVEVGVYQGGSAWYLYQVAHAQRRVLHLFDTFYGMPFQDEGDIFPVGSFNATTAADVQRALPEAVLHPGIFPYTLTNDAQGIAFAHIDVDQYRSTRDAIAALLPRMVKGGIMAFDDYPGIEGVVKAVNEAFPSNVQSTYHRYAYVVIDR